MRDGEEIKCRVCGEGFFTIWGEKDGEQLWQCIQCELVFSYPYPTQEALTEKYNSDYHADRHYDGTGVEGGLRRRMYELDIADLEKAIKHRGLFLDVGCAEGLFASMLSSNGRWIVFCHDISKEAMKKVDERKERSLGGSMFFTLSGGIETAPTSTLSVVHLRGTIEHMLHPCDLFHAAHRALKSGGWLVLSNTPNVGSMVARAFRGNYRWVLPGEHVNLMSMKTVERLAKDHGFEVVRVRYPYFRTPYASWLDPLRLIINFMRRRVSPPWWGDIMTIYLRKRG